MKIFYTALVLGLSASIFSGCEQHIENKPIESKPNSTENHIPREYYRDTITLYIPTQTGPQFLTADFNRRELQEKTGFQHYYFLDYNDGKNTFSDSLNFVASDKNPQEKGFLKHWKNELFEDLSTRENYEFSLNLEGQEYEVKLSDLQADFLTKNTPEYTRYTSAGKAVITKNGSPVEAYAVLEKAYSSDDSLYVYFEGYSELKSKTSSMHLWDEDGNYYYIDKTKVLSDQKNYRSHTWLMQKDMLKNITQKSFSAEVKFSQAEKRWKINMPDFGKTFDLKTKTEFNSNPTSGPVFGTLTDDSDGKTKKVEGWFSYYGL